MEEGLLGHSFLTNIYHKGAPQYHLSKESDDELRQHTLLIFITT